MRELLRSHLATVLVFISFMANITTALGRDIYVNGVPLDPDQIALLDVWNCVEVPDGRYWVNWETLAWGYEEGPQQGVIGCFEEDVQPDVGSDDSSDKGEEGFWEDRMCYQYGFCGL